MKIATWNVERLKHYKDIAVIKQEIEKCDADIQVLTETDNRLSLAYPFYYHTLYLTGEQIVPYADTENRVSIFSKFECVEEHTTYDENTAICRGLRTDRGDLAAYVRVSMDEFDRVVFESIVEKVLVGGFDEEGYHLSEYG